MPCLRCGGWTIPEDVWAFDERLRFCRWLCFSRCFNCGDRFDDVILFHRQNRPAPRREIATTTYDADRWVIRWKARL